MVSLRRDEPTARYDIGDWSDNGVRYSCVDALRIPVPIRAPVRNLAGSYASSKQLRRQEKAWRDLQTGCWLPEKIAGGSDDRSDADVAQMSRPATLDGAAFGAETCQDRDSRARQHNSADRLAVMSSKEVDAAASA